MHQVRDLLVKKMTATIHKSFSNYVVNMYGSHATGLCLHWSDIDFVVGPANDVFDKDLMCLNYEARIKESLRRIAENLKKEMANKWVIDVNYIEAATVPVIKLKCSLSTIMEQAGLKYPKNPKYKNIYHQKFSIDITHKTEFHNGIKCVELVREYLLDCWFIEPLILVLKQILKVNGLNDPWKGGLSSYGLLLMIVAFI